MKRCKSKYLCHPSLLFGLIAVPVIHLCGQEVFDEDEDIYELSPFEVSTTENDGYSATETLGGTRIRTDYRDLATPMSAVTAQFLEDTASKNNQDLLTYTTNTEVGGLYGNWGGFGNDQGISDREALLAPNNNTRVRGLDQADNTRNFFLTEIPWDSFNVDRVEIQRGPNSILFGVGSPAGIINTTTIVAQMNGNSGKIENTYSIFNSNRVVADYNVELIDDTLAVRFAGLYNDQKFRQKPAFNEDERFFATATFQKQFLPSEWADKTIVRLSYETAEVTSNNPRILPPEDGITLWFDDVAGDGVMDPMGMGKSLVDLYMYRSAGAGGTSFGSLSDSNILDPIYVPGTGQIDSGNLNNGGLGFFFINGQSRPFFVSRQRQSFIGGIDGDGNIDNTVDIPYGSPMRVTGYNNYAIQIDEIDTNEGNPSRFPLATRNYYKDRSLTDPTIFDFYNYLIDGDNKREYKDWDSTNFSIAQTFLKSRLGIEFVYDNQNYRQWREGVTWQRPYISIDINKNLAHQLSQYSRVPDPTGRFPDGLLDRSTYSVRGFTPTAEQPYANPMAGAAFTGGSYAGNTMTSVDRETTRFTGFAELRASDFMDPESWICKILGRHIFTGLMSREEKLQTSTSWVPVATTYDWALSKSENGANTKLGDGARGVTSIVYLSDPLFNVSSASGLNLGPITTNYNVAGTYVASTFDAIWAHSLDPNNPDYVDPSAFWVRNAGNGSIDPSAGSIQAENPYNYIGWVDKPAYILNAKAGERDQLITQYDVTEQVVDSKGLVWQGYFLGGLLVPTVGWREDTLQTFTASGNEDATGITSTQTGPLSKVIENTGETVSWGVVAHMPQKWVEKVKLLSGLSAYYNVGENSKVQARYNFDGNPLDNPAAESEDYGVIISLFEDKLTLKLGHYETKITNGNLPGGASLIGANQYYLYNLEAWGTGNSLLYLFGREGLTPNNSWHWNWANVDSNDGVDYSDPSSSAFQNHSSTIAQTASIDAWINGMDQEFFDNYEIPFNVTEIQSAYNTYKTSGDIQPLIAAATASGFPVGSYTNALNSLNDGLIKGIAPNGAIDSTSKGWEAELNYRPVPNWNMQLNVSKTDAYRESLGKPMLDFIDKQWERIQGPAGDIRLWWGGDRTIRRYYEDNIMAAVRFQEESIGFQAPELRPWHGSFITNYSFSGDKFKGINIGGAMRYQDKQILGYGLKDDESGLDVEKPIYGDTETRIDAWIGYEKSLSKKVDWRIQINFRNIGEDVSLTPISANPNGTIAAQRITEGMTWSVTNTFRF